MRAMKFVFRALIFALLLGGSTSIVAISFAQTSIYKAPVSGPSAGTQRVALTYRASFDIPAPVDGEVKVTVPFPADDEVQRVEKYSFGSAMSPEKLLSVSLQRDAVYGNRTLEIRVLNPAPNDELVFEYVISRKEKSNPLDVPMKLDAQILPAEKKFAELRGSAEDNEQIVKFAQTIVKPEMTRDQQITAIYNYAISPAATKGNEDGKIEGNKEVSPWKPQHGDSGEVSNLAAGVARAAEIPAKLEFGILIPAGKEAGEISSFHTWAGLHHSQRGWIPIDAFEGAARKRYSDYYLGRLDSNRITFTVGRESWEYSMTDNIIAPRAEIVERQPQVLPMKLEISFKRLPSSNPMITPAQSSGVE